MPTPTEQEILEEFRNTFIQEDFDAEWYGDGHYCKHHPDDPAHGESCYLHPAKEKIAKWLTSALHHLEEATNSKARHDAWESKAVQLAYEQGLSHGREARDGEWRAAIEKEIELYGRTGEVFDTAIQEERLIEPYRNKEEMEKVVEHCIVRTDFGEELLARQNAEVIKIVEEKIDALNLGGQLNGLRDDILQALKEE